MKQYMVFMTDLNVTPLNGQNPRGGRIENFDELTVAQAFAEKEKNSWDLVSVFERIKNGKLEKVEQYQKGKKYKI